MLLDHTGRPLAVDPTARLRDPVDGYTPPHLDGALSADLTRDLSAEVARVHAMRADASAALAGARTDGERMDATARIKAYGSINLDAFVNELTNVGTLADKSRGGYAGGPAFALYLQSNPEAEARWRGSDLGANIVNKIPDEMTREGWAVQVQPSDDDAKKAKSPGALMDACKREPARAAAAWRKAARAFPRSDARRMDCERHARRWDSFEGASEGIPQGTPPAPSAPPAVPPVALPKVNDEGIELAAAIEEWAEAVDVMGAITTALKYERAFGGALILIGADDGVDDLTQPLNPKRVKAITHLTPFTGGLQGEAVMWRPYNDPRKANYGKPEIYQVRNTGVQLARPPAPGETLPVSQLLPCGPTGPTIFYVHESRFLVFDGEPTSRQTQQQMRGWGDSIFTRVNDVLSQYDQTWNAIAIIMQEYSVATLGIDGLSKALASGADAARATFIQYARFQALTQSVARMRFIDKDEEFNRVTASIAGVPELMKEWANRLAAAADMPVAVLFGQNAGGLGDADSTALRGFYDKIRSKQERRLLPQLQRLYRLAWQAQNSPTKGVEPERWAVTFYPLWQPNATARADIRLKTAQADQIEITTQVVTPEEVAATRYGGAEYNDGPITLDLESRGVGQDYQLRKAASFALEAEATPNAPAAPGTSPGITTGAQGIKQAMPVASGAASIIVPPMTAMPSDPITGDPESTPSEVGQTGNGGKPLPTTAPGTSTALVQKADGRNRRRR